MISATRAEVCAIACAELFRDASEIMVSPMTTMVSIGHRASLAPHHDRRLAWQEQKLVAA